MKKCAVFVEGQSEMIFVADFLEKYFDYDSKQLSILCLDLKKDHTEPRNYPKMGDKNSENQYLIINVGNDNSVGTIIKRRIDGMIKNAYDIVIGLRDVYGDIYQSKTDKHEVNQDIIREMYEKQYKPISNLGIDCRLHFAIMEYEAWMLGLIEGFIAERGGDIEDIIKEIGHDFRKDIEKIYHPTKIVKEIYHSLGDTYGKHEHDTRQFLSHVDKDDYLRLIHSGACPSFNTFVTSLVGGPIE